jgi:hypothetical protein
VLRLPEPGGVDVRVVLLIVLLCLMPTPASARWLKKPCARGPDGRCVEVPCGPFLDEMRLLATQRRKADDPGCPGHAQSSHQADLHQENVDRRTADMSTACIRKAAAIIRPVASIDVRRSYEDAGHAVAMVRYTNNTQRTLQNVVITCSAMRDTATVAVGKGVARGPIPAGARRDLEVKIDLAGAAFSCVECHPLLEP